MVLLAGVLTQIGPVRRARAQISPGPLARAHQSVDGPLNCLKCHTGKAEAMGKACLACHAPIAQLMSQGRGLHATVKEQKCAACHPEHAGHDFSLIHWEGGAPEKFDHQRTGWVLEGKHAKAACRDCHKPANQKSSLVKDMPAAHRADSWLGLERDCKSCHQDVHMGALDANCASCHELAGWKPPTKFDHARTEYPLTGKHVKAACAACHKTTQAVTLNAGGTKSMVLFKPQAHAECSDCHKDPHQGQLGPKCSTCHTTDDFHKVATDRFDHGKTRFALQGKHVALTCAQCHDAAKAWGAKPAFDRCAACHKDPHAGEATLGGQKADCAACHNAQGFRPSTYTVARHEKAAYPLTGKHQDLECAACHPKAAASRAPSVDIVRLRPRFGACRDCHAEAHATQLAARPDKGACETCHTPRGWKPSLFGLAEHAALKLPLDGRHAEIACADCHGRTRHDLPPLPAADRLGTAGVAVVLPGAACADCHVNVHRDAAASNRAIDAACLTCHTTRAFRPSRVDVSAHRGYTFPLEGAHQAVPCADCHKGMKRPGARAALLAVKPAPVALTFGQASKLCRDCHEGPHGTQFDARAGGNDCALCHGTDAFAPATRFDHNKDAAFSLKGAHQPVACDKCHATQTAPGGRPRIIYRPVDARCESCHARGSVKP